MKAGAVMVGRQGSTMVVAAAVLGVLTFGVGSGSAGSANGRDAAGEAAKSRAVAKTGAAANTGAELRQSLDRVIAAPDGSPGLSVLINRNGKSEYLRRGLADVPAGLVPGRKLHLRIASVAKAFSG
ncbi:MAG: hypothetical protein JJE10_11200, partial [Thermoleophilia bacterium]|nr:hypothetical protein [Thermoleophilia bacterium]